MQVVLALNASSIMRSTCIDSWNFSVDPCAVRASPQFTCGIDCSPPGKNGVLRITGIRLESGAGYAGTLSPAIGNLTALQRLVISNNQFHGAIPTTLSQCKELIQLDLSANAFTSGLPASLGLLSNLGFISVAYNNLDGSVPSSFNGLSNVTHMYLNNNRLSGNFPSLTGMVSLYYLDASSNNFSGALTTAFPSSLSLLSLKGNQLTGHLPPSLKNLTLLQALDLRNNQLNGSVDAFIFSLPNLQQLNLSYNFFTSLEVFNFSGVNSQLLSLDLSFNRIRGGLPESMAGLKKLTVLALRSNMFTGPIPYTYALKAANSLNGTEQLGQLYLDNNYLSGNIPLPLLRLSPDAISANLVNNCLQSCPPSLFFCQGGTQKSQKQCKASENLV